MQNVLFYRNNKYFNYDIKLIHLILLRFITFTSLAFILMYKRCMLIHPEPYFYLTGYFIKL